MEEQQQVNNVTAWAFTVKDSGRNYSFVRAVKFNPLMGGCLPIGEIKTKKTL